MKSAIISLFAKILQRVHTEATSGHRNSLKPDSEEERMYQQV